MSITREFNLFLNAGAASPLVINVNQYDQGEQWVFTLYTDSGVQYVPSTGGIVGIKSDGLGILNTGTVDSDGRVVINETQQMTAAVGEAVFELILDNTTHGTANFRVLVEEKPGDNASLSDSDLSLLQEAIDSVNPVVIAGAVEDWMDDNLAPSQWVIDSSLSVSGAAADAKAAGDQIRQNASDIGDLTDLVTEDQSSLVGAINETRTDLYNWFTEDIEKVKIVYEGDAQDADEYEIERLEWSSAEDADITGLKVITKRGSTTVSKFLPDGDELMEYVIGDTSELEGTITEEISDLKSHTGDGWTNDQKETLLALLEHMGFGDATGRTLYDAFHDALYPPIPATAIVLNESSIAWAVTGQTKQLSATLTPSNSTDTVSWSSSDSSVATVSDDGLVTGVALGSATITATAGSVSASCSVVIAEATVTSISAVFTQGANVVYDTDPLDSLKQYLVVTATWSDSTTSIVANSDYALNGTLEVGTSTITVSYGGETDTFTVTVSQRTLVYHWDFTGENPLVDKVSSKTATASGTVTYDATNGLALGSASSNVALGFNASALIGCDVEIEMGAMVSTGNASAHQRLFTFNNSYGFICRKDDHKWNIYGQKSGSNTWQPTTVSQNGVANKTVKLSVYSTSHIDVYLDGEMVLENGECQLGSNAVRIGATSTSTVITTVKSLKVYMR